MLDYQKYLEELRSELYGAGRLATDRDLSNFINTHIKPGSSYNQEDYSKLVFLQKYLELLNNKKFTYFYNNLRTLGPINDNNSEYLHYIDLSNSHLNVPIFLELLKTFTNDIKKINSLGIDTMIEIGIKGILLKTRSDIDNNHPYNYVHLGVEILDELIKIIESSENISTLTTIQIYPELKIV